MTKSETKGIVVSTNNLSSVTCHRNETQRNETISICFLIFYKFLFQITTTTTKNQKYYFTFPYQLFYYYFIVVIVVVFNSYCLYESTDIACFYFCSLFIESHCMRLYLGFFITITAIIITTALRLLKKNFVFKFVISSIIMIWIAI